MPKENLTFGDMKEDIFKGNESKPYTGTISLIYVSLPFFSLIKVFVNLREINLIIIIIIIIYSRYYYLPNTDFSG